jgi:hypothetical protein
MGAAVIPFAFAGRFLDRFGFFFLVWDWKFGLALVGPGASSLRLLERLWLFHRIYTLCLDIIGSFCLFFIVCELRAVS